MAPECSGVAGAPFSGAPRGRLGDRLRPAVARARRTGLRPAGNASLDLGRGGVNARE